MNRAPNSQVQFEKFCDEIKAWLRSLTAFPRRIPQKDLAMVGEVDDSTFSMHLSPKHSGIPKTWSLLKIAAATGTQVQLFEILGRYAQVDAKPELGYSGGLSMLQADAEAFGRLTGGLASDLNDKDSPLRITAEEALQRLPDALKAKEAVENTVATLVKLAGGPR